MEAFEPAGSEDVITQNDVAPEAGRLMQSDHPGVAVRDVGNHLVQSKVVEAIVENQNLRLLCDATPPILQRADENRSELAAPIAPVEVHDSDGSHLHWSCTALRFCADSYRAPAGIDKPKTASSSGVRPA